MPVQQLEVWKLEKRGCLSDIDAPCELCSPIARRLVRSGYTEIMLRPADTQNSDGPDSAYSNLHSQLEETAQFARLKNEFLLRVHAPTEMRETSYVLANELRRLGNCDRVIVLARRGSRLRVEAISNLDQFDVRSAVVRAAEQFGAAFDAEAGPRWLDEEEANVDEVSPWLRNFVEHSHSRTLGILPLFAAPRPREFARLERIGMIICERFVARSFEPAVRRELEEMSEHAAVAISRAAALERIPLFRSLRAISRIGLLSPQGSRTKRVLLAVLIVSLFVCAAVWPIPFVISAPGSLQPANRHEIFAPADGVVHDLKLSQDGHVVAGDILIEIRSDEFELELTRLAGELETNRRRLQTIQAARLESVKPGVAKGEPQGRLAAEEEQLKEVIRGLESQQAFRQKQRDQLFVRSPISGQLLTWEVERLLRARPVRRGQRLMTIADVDGAWTSEMHIADADVGHVLAAVQKQATPLKVTYRTAAHPNVDQVGSLDKISDWTEISDSGQPAVKMTATIAKPDSLDARPGAKTSASIHLGSRPRAYVWFRQVIEYVRIHFWF